MGQKVNAQSVRLPITKRWHTKTFISKFNYTNLFLNNIRIEKYVSAVLYSFKIICNACLIKQIGDKLFISLYIYNLKEQNNKKIKFVKACRFLNKKTKVLNKKGPVLSLATFLENALVKLTSIKEIKIRIFPTYSIRKKKQIKSISRISRAYRIANSLSYLLLLESAFSTRNATLLARFISLNFYQHVRNIRFFMRFLDKMLDFLIRQYRFKGIKISFKGRLNGARRARFLVIQKGEIPLNTLSSNISYGFSSALTIYSSCSIKVWLHF